jgi:beta-lactamase regulating signal transducer with metallopeptidase domain
MFFLRGLAVSLSFFIVLYCLLSAIIVAAWRAIPFKSISARLSAALLFLARIFPVGASVVLTSAMVVPSFIRLEPRTVDEEFGAVPILLLATFLLFLVLGLYRGISAQRQTSRALKRWLNGASTLETGSATLALQAEISIPPLTLVGILNPRVLVSGKTIALLNAEELRIAVRHELAHMRSRDNLKRLLFRLTPFPAMRQLESAWMEVAELAADDAAVTSVPEALDLAAALLKLSRLIVREPIPAFAVGLTNPSGLITARVTRLLSWTDEAAVTYRTRWGILVVPMLAALIFTFANYSPALAITHRASEWLIR